MLRTHNCGTLNINNVNTEVVLSGWVQKTRELGGMTFVELRDRYGITQLTFNLDVNASLCTEARKLGREFVIQIIGKVVEGNGVHLIENEVETPMPKFDRDEIARYISETSKDI